ncbi:LAFA_0D14070g1_1 [Lachancea sp. 'fantastica']|nr:LAFA_0D14070g1_1 [Lachancea sp. 'fantastica']
MSTRDVSTSSSFSSRSNGPIVLSKSPAQKLPPINPDEVLRYATIIIILEYISEPRFRKREVVKSTGQFKVPESRNTRSGHVKRAKRRSWLFSDDDGKKEDEIEAKQLQKFMPALENYLQMVAMKKIRVEPELLRRSLLKFYNDSFLDPKARIELRSLKRAHELIILFTKALQGELKKVPSKTDGKEELYNQIFRFTDIITDLAWKEESIRTPLGLRLKEHKESLGISGGGTSSLSPVTSRTSPGPIVLENSAKPSFKISDVKCAKYLMEVFDLPEVEFQQKMVKFVNEIDSNEVKKYLHAVKATVVRQHTPGPTSLESEEQNMKRWFDKEVKDIEAVIQRAYGAYELNSEACSENANKKLTLFPSNPNVIYVHLVCQIFKKCKNMASFNLNKDAFFLINKCASYWNLAWPTTKATAVLHAANVGLLDAEDLNPRTLEGIFELISTKVFEGMDLAKERRLWNHSDRDCWSENLIYSLEQTFNSLTFLISEIHHRPRPKFSQTLNVYYQIISMYELLEEDVTSLSVYKKHLKRLRRTFFKATEDFYVSLVKDLPRDRHLEFFDVKNIADKILSEIQSMQKMYSKPLLNEINLVLESARVLLQAFGLDCAAILTQVQKNFEADGDGKLPFYDAVETYRSLREIRDVFHQVQDANEFPFALEKHFLKYVSRLCDDACINTVDVVRTALTKENWMSVNASVGYSTSVIDVFKMINESMDLFVKLEWPDEYQISKIYTYLLKAVADGLSVYASCVTKEIEKDITAGQDEKFEEVKDDDSHKGLSPFAYSTKKKVKSSWVYTEMRNALKSADVVTPRPFEFQLRTCTCLSNLNQILLLINDLEDRIDPESISRLVRKQEQADSGLKKMSEKQNRNLRRLYTIKVLRAENLSGSAQGSNTLAAVSIVDSRLRREIAKTRDVLTSGRAVWNEEFEIDAPLTESRFLNVIIWCQKPKFGSSSPSVYGRAHLSLEPNKFKEDGLPRQLLLNLDTRGRVVVEIAVETEKLDALFSMGRAFRSISRALDRSIELMVGKFQVFVHFAFSRMTLKTVCGPNGLNQPDGSIVYDSIEPLFDYLNANLDILASHLPRELLLKIMLEAWEVVVTRADELLLPHLYEAFEERNSNSKNKAKTIWENAMDAAKHGINATTASERPLTQIEVHTVFEWLHALCFDFFHNNGEGPAIKDLKNKHYQALLFIPVYYDQPNTQLKAEAENLLQEYHKLLFNIVDTTDIGNSAAPKFAGQRAKSLARRKTILANASRKRRVQLDKEIEVAENSHLDKVTATQDILLRILISKGECAFVARNLEARESLDKALLTQNIVQAARSSRKG